ncbi:hypothetical protein [Thalassomonas haliotis]|uniref:Uncharacterized protein n=1 Tax=Thalassomonas haliotis TaxID=485448 RepID=A0ABY7VAQ6_9GAMM|nr:hypothetical protein [Thalassomonas haliotis]WDE09972.1 hypothetical protein H3N35_16890 [Thalassomonas haliotis]
MIDILGIAIAFITTMLLFSVLVTAIVQFVQQLFARKHLGLVNGMSKFAAAITEIESGFNGKKFLLQVTSGIVIKKAQYVDFDKVREVYHLLSVDKPITDVRLQQMFEQAEDEMRTVFKRQMDKISICVAAIIVLLMQLDAFALLNRLSVDNDFRQALVQQGQSIQQKAEINQSPSLSAIFQKVNLDFSDKYSALYPSLEALKQQQKNTSAEAISAFEQLVRQLPSVSDKQVQVLLMEYQAALEQGIAQVQQQATSFSLEQYRSLSKFGFQVLPKKSIDYYLSLQTLLGLFFSVILISLGAPFWFNTLKSVVGLKDTIALKHETGKGGKPG